MNRHIYLSYYLDRSTPLYGGETGIIVHPDRSIKEGDTANTKKLELSNHAGTHIDFPNHFFDNGKQSQDYEASFWVFSKPFLLQYEAVNDQLIDLSDETIGTIPADVDFLIIKTGFFRYRSEAKYWNNNPGLHPDLAVKLKTRFKFLRIIGGDYISITSFQNRVIGRQAHKNFLGDPPILLVEDMDLALLRSSPVKLMCFPLMVNEVDGSPVTIIAEIE